MATLLPEPKQSWSDSNGTPLAGGTIDTYVPGTFTPKTTWQDADQTILNTNPIVLDAAGRSIIYGAGIYRFIVKDANGNQVYDQLTADTAVGGIAFGGTSTGTPNAQVISASSFSQQDGQVVYFIAGLTNNGPMTVTPGGGTPIPVLADSPTGPTPLAGGEIATDNAVGLLYDNSLGAFHLLTPAFGTIASQNANNVNITGGTVAGVTINASTINQPTLTLKQGVNPSPTAEGDAQWSTLYDTINVGDGVATKRFWAGPAPGVIYGCTIANNVTDATNDIDFAAGVATDSTNIGYINFTSLMTKRLDALWAAGTNNGGLFSGAIANTTYHCFIIQNPTTGAVDAGFDTSVTAANRPAGYTYFRRVGSIVRASAAILGFVQYGDEFVWSSKKPDLNISPAVTTAVTLALTVPVGLVVRASVTVSAGQGPSSTNWFFLVSPLSIPDVAPSANAYSTWVSGSSSTNQNTNTAMTVPTNTLAQVRYRVNTTNLDNIQILTTGWIDTRGRLEA